MPPDVIRDPEEMLARCESRRRNGEQVAFVPSMGSLHQGHLSLVEIANRAADVTVVSIFVNPTQFGPNEDLEKYPRDLEADVKKLSSHRVDAVFSPSPKAMYPDGFDTEITVGGLTETLCGPHRPGHFNGVATVVTKLLNIIGPCKAVFGRKDFQQLKVIEKLVRDLNLPVEIVSGPTVREPDGLAMSSRNAYLSAEERHRALSLSKGLRAARVLFENGERGAVRLLEAVKNEVVAAADSVDYIDIANPKTLVSLSEKDLVKETVLVAVAARVGSTRLIDNVVLGEDTAP
jgi:pantoate--beta-alanine ligase